MSSDRKPVLETVSPPAQVDPALLCAIRARNQALAKTLRGDRPTKAFVLPGRFLGRPTSQVVYLLTSEHGDREFALGRHYRVFA